MAVSFSVFFVPARPVLENVHQDILFRISPATGHGDELAIGAVMPAAWFKLGMSATNPKNPDRYSKSIKPIKLRESRIMLEVAGFDMEFMGFLPFPVLSQVQAASATRNWVGI